MISGFPMPYGPVWFKIPERIEYGEWAYFVRYWYNKDGLIKFDELHSAGTWPGLRFESWVEYEL